MVPGLCNRTAQVRDTIVAAVVGKSTCGAITATDVAGVTRLSVTSLASLEAGDFNNFTNLKYLYGNTGKLVFKPEIDEEKLNYVADRPFSGSKDLRNLWESRNCTPTGSRFPCTARALKSQVEAR